MKTSLKTISLLASAALFTLSSFASVNTVPVGYSTWNIAAGTGTARTFTTLSLPLYQPSSSTTGASTGVITGVTSSTITVSNANWSIGELSQSDMPFCLRITKDGSEAEGRTLLISTSTQNTADTVTIDLSRSNVDDLTTLGIVANTDTFELIECDTLSSLFGEPTAGGVIGGAFTTADNIWIFTTGWSRYYYNADLSRWTKFFPGNPDATNEPILPDSGILYSRLAETPSKFVVTGTVPSTDREVTINATGLTALGSSWPTDVTLATSNLDQIPELATSTNFNSADLIWINSSGSWRQYYFDGADWRRRFPGTPVSNDVVISSGSAILIQRISPASGDLTFNQSIPYTL